MSFVQGQAVCIKSIQSFLIQEQDTLSSLTGVSLVISFLWNFQWQFVLKEFEGIRYYLTQFPRLYSVRHLLLLINVKKILTWLATSCMHAYLDGPHWPSTNDWFMASVRPSVVNSWNFRALISFLAYVKVQTNVAVVSQGSCFVMSVDKTTRFQRETARE